VAWKKQEEERERLQHEIAQKLKEERVEQLDDKRTRRQRVRALRACQSSRSFMTSLDGTGVCALQ